MTSKSIELRALTADRFKSYGQIIQHQSKHSLVTNNGEALRHNDLAELSFSRDGGRPSVSIFEVRNVATLPFTLRLMERHPISTQMFVPLDNAMYIIVVAPRSEKLDTRKLEAFMVARGEGINLAAGVWHHPLISLTKGDFLVLDRTITGSLGDQDYEEVGLDGLELRVGPAA